MIVQYDLSQDIASTDCFSWACLAAAEGATEVVFRTDRGFKTNKWPRERVIRRLETMLMPGMALLGLRCRIGNDGVRTWHNPGNAAWELQRHALAGRSFPRMKTVMAPGIAEYVIILREDTRVPEKNSNMPAWRKFADEIGAHIVEDFDTSPMHPHSIMSLCAGARMTFAVNSGQAWLACLSPYPVTIFDTTNEAGSIKHYFPKCGVPIGEKWAWFDDSQQIVWESDNLNNLRRYFETWERKKRRGVVSSPSPVATPCPAAPRRAGPRPG